VFYVIVLAKSQLRETLKFSLNSTSSFIVTGEGFAHTERLAIVCFMHLYKQASEKNQLCYKAISVNKQKFYSYLEKLVPSICFVTAFISMHIEHEV
jgi:hypothetical protein